MLGLFYQQKTNAFRYCTNTHCRNDISDQIGYKDQYTLISEGESWRFQNDSPEIRWFLFYYCYL
jgi:hypothetical protein